MEENLIQIKGAIMINVDVSIKNIIHVKKILWNSAAWSRENGKYLASVIDDSVITCDEIIEETKIIPKKR